MKTGCAHGQIDCPEFALASVGVECPVVGSGQHPEQATAVLGDSYPLPLTRPATRLDRWANTHFQQYDERDHHGQAQLSPHLEGSPLRAAPNLVAFYALRLCFQTCSMMNELPGAPKDRSVNYSSRFTPFFLPAW